jgi:DNA mismatch repair protein MutS2
MHALRVLEFGAIKERLARHCEMSLSAAAAEDLEPSFDTETVWRSLDETQQAYDLLSRDAPPSLGAVWDLRDALRRAGKGGVLGGAELYQIGDLLASLRSVRQFLSSRSAAYPRLAELTLSFPDAPRLESALHHSLEPSGDVRDAASDALAGLRRRKQSTASKVIERIQSYVSGRTHEFLSDPLYTVRDGRYVLPVKSEHRAKIKGIVHDTSGSGRTVYIEPEDVLQISNQLREIESEERDEIQRILGELSGKVGAVAEETIRAIEDAAKLDLLLAKARFAFALKAGLPERGPEASIEIDGGRHPMLDPATVVPVSLAVGNGFEGLLITGPNTGGKTVGIKCLGLFVLMAQAGLFLPARRVVFGPFSQVWADIGDEQSIQQSLSTFSGHIKNIAAALKGLQPGALALFDELGAGTDPAEGAALAKTILRRFKAIGAKIVASTHYGELKAFAYSEPGFQNAAMEFDQKSLRPTYRLIMGAPGASHALKIAERYGIPSDLIEEAVSELGSQHRDVADMLDKLEQAQRLARQAQGQADRRADELRRMEETAAKKLAEAEESKRKANAQAKELIEETLRSIRLEAAEIFDELKRSGTDAKAMEHARSQLKALQSVGEEEIQRFRPKESAKRTDTALQKGMAVRVDGYSQPGVLIGDPKEGQVAVQMGPLKLTVAVADVRPDPKAKPEAPRKPKPKSNAGLEKSMTATTEIHLRAMRAEDALEELERFIDGAVLGGIHQVRIVHGKGEGILRKLTQDYLRRHPQISNYREGEPAEGGQGVTIATIK